MGPATLGAGETVGVADDAELEFGALVDAVDETAVGAIGSGTPVLSADAEAMSMALLDL